MVRPGVWWPLLVIQAANPKDSLQPIPLKDTIILIDETDTLPGKDKYEEEDVVGEKKVEAYQKGGYKTSEKIHKPPKFDHPCNLTRTSVKISFPALKDELFVNFLGYKEPNLVYLWRCKGVCGETSTSVACSPTRVTEKKVNMMFKVKVRCVSLLA